MYSDGCHAEFVISPYKEGEGDLPPPRNALEDYYDHKAWSRDRSSPSWAQ